VAKFHIPPVKIREWAGKNAKWEDRVYSTINMWCTFDWRPLRGEEVHESGKNTAAFIKAFDISMSGGLESKLFCGSTEKMCIATPCQREMDSPIFKSLNQVSYIIRVKLQQNPTSSF